LTDALPILPLFLLPALIHYLPCFIFCGLLALRLGPEVHALSAVETILVNHYANAATAAVLKTAHHSPAAIDLHVRLRSDNIGGKRQCEIHSRTDRDIYIHAEEDAIGGNIFRLNPLCRYCGSGSARLTACRLQSHRQFYWKARRGLYVRVPPAILADISNDSFGGFRHVCDDLPSSSFRAQLGLRMCTFQAEITPRHQQCKVTEVMEQRRRSAGGTGT